jgi:lipopolysaccharide biosynthesis protein
MNDALNKIRTIAIYLPQFHPIEENNKWWGNGFTEWTNVSKARELFDGHYQPHIPADLGFYDLRFDETRIKQANLAKEHGIDGFCYYHYWFNGKQLLETPIKRLLETKKPDFPFCVCWANENWTRTWDGLENDILIAQIHNHEDDKNFIQSLIPYFMDKRYIKIDEKPLLIIYRTELFPDIKKTSEIWREEIKKAGFDDIYLVRVEGFVRDINPKEIGFDATMEFSPDYHVVGENLNQQLGLSQNAKVYDYQFMMNNIIRRKSPDYKMFRCVTPHWDNTARKGKNATMLVNSSPESYRFWLSEMTDYTVENLIGEEKLLFINAWNEWAEGNHLEPDLKFGLKYLQMTKEALRRNTKNEMDMNYVEQLIVDNNLAQVKEVISILLKKNKQSIDLLNNLSVIHILEKNYNLAIQTITEVLSLDFNNNVALENLQYIDSLLNENKEIKNDKSTISVS